MKTIIKWEEINYFKKTENWGNIDKIVPDLVYTIDAFRHFVGKPFIINCAYESGGHSDGSQHYLGKAIDGYFKDMHWLDQYLAALEFGKFNGIGVYPDWKTPGLHLDIRSVVDGNKVTWLRYGGNYNYNVNQELIMSIMLEQMEQSKTSKKTSKKEKAE